MHASRCSLRSSGVEVAASYPPERLRGHYKIAAARLPACAVPRQRAMGDTAANAPSLQGLGGPDHGPRTRENPPTADGSPGDGDAAGELADPADPPEGRIAHAVTAVLDVTSEATVLRRSNSDLPASTVLVRGPSAL